MLIGEVAKATGLPKDTIRYYTKLGLLEADAQQAGSRKYANYNEDVIEIVKVIKHAQQSGFSLQEIRLYLFDIMSGKIPPKGVVKILEAKLKDIRAQQESLKETELMLQDSISMFAKKAMKQH